MTYKLLICFAILYSTSFNNSLYSQSKEEKLKAIKTKETEETQKLYMYNTETLLEDYKRFGVKSPKWDKDVHAGLEECARVWSKLQSGSNVLKHLNKAIQNGCKDPLVNYVAYRFKGKETDKYIKNCLATINESKYSLTRKLFANINCKTSKEWKQKNYQKLILDKIALLMNDQKTPLNLKLIFLSTFNYYLIKHTNDYPITLKKIETALKDVPADNIAAHYWRGLFYVKWAWKARGHGYAKTVSQQGWKLFKERMRIANKHLLIAYQKAPECAFISEQLCAVHMALKGNNKEFETFYKEAIWSVVHQPSNLYNIVLIYLDPRWGGSYQKMIEFGRWVNSTGRKWQGLSLTLIDAHWKVAQALTGERNPSSMHPKMASYFSDQKIWNEIHQVYKDLNRKTDAPSHLRFAYWGNDHKTAIHLLNVIDPNLDISFLFEKNEQHIEAFCDWLLKAPTPKEAKLALERNINLKMIYDEIKEGF